MRPIIHIPKFRILLLGTPPQSPPLSGSGRKRCPIELKPLAKGYICGLLLLMINGCASVKVQHLRGLATLSDKDAYDVS
ncbi:hypothetical protein CEXT_672691 [Caerostris extrusa]|uniref:Uncharacterized protein n=1 Tax=Caerostris extrusa TaxID=172846 RepID=A0AAV4QQA1_CAEEX|nr:hypothetical protein CEXT_672691 [Caerostris extrusa]